MVSLRRLDALGRSVVAHDGDADEARQRRLTDLEFVEPRDDAVDRVVDLHDVERDRRRGPMVMSWCIASQPLHASVVGDREREGALDRGEPDHAQQERVHLGVEGLADVALDALALAPPESVRVDRSRALGGLGDRAGHRRVAHALAQVAGRGVVQVVARREEQDRQRHQAGDRRERTDDGIAMR